MSYISAMETTPERAPVEPDATRYSRREYWLAWQQKKLEIDPDYFRRAAKKYRALHPEGKKAINERYRAKLGTDAYGAMMREAQIRARDADREAARLRARETNARRREKRKAYNKKVAHTPAVLARQTLAQAVRSGKVVKPTVCSECLTETPPRRLHGHHEDYSRPLDVKWLCSLCHGKQHRMTA